VDDDVPYLGAFPGFYNPLQKARMYETLLVDAEALRAQAVDRRGKITNARLFEKSILLRERLLSDQAEIMNFFQNQDVMHRVFQEIRELCKKVPKEIVVEFLEKIRALQKERLTAVPG
jgi:hypothetical protein